MDLTAIWPRRNIFKSREISILFMYFKVLFYFKFRERRIVNAISGTTHTKIFFLELCNNFNKATNKIFQKDSDLVTHNVS